MIKNLFNELKKIGNKKYLFNNGDEELYFIGKNLTVEISSINNNIDIVIEKFGIRTNYRDCDALSVNSKNGLTAILNSHIVNRVSCQNISQILLEALE